MNNVLQALYHLRLFVTWLLNDPDHGVEPDRMSNGYHSLSIHDSILISHHGGSEEDKREISYSPDRVRLGRGREFPPGAGMENLGNTCYMNNVLQALYHLRPFVNWLLNDPDHGAEPDRMSKGYYSLLIQ
ncbi:hypothetical protein QAD02_005404 [Eretmocerus hayati]|uniref:Uncharacterized protein n=1 Tax=Eretmocerus hayati TaxID=131215 RepID=A0ACC2NV87_9HYME|nr:hypothetical protein QAD02_005404 [Eretmocerus hayati]